MTDPLARDMQRREFFVKKDAVPCMIMTTTNRIAGRLHKRSAFRILDELNGEDRFIAVTDLTIYDDKSDTVLEADFLALRSDKIVWVRPIADQSIDELGGVRQPTTD